MKSTSLLVLLALFQLVALPARGQSVFISELADPRLNYLTDRFIEIYNPGPGVVDLTGWNLVAVGNGADIFTWGLSGVIQPGEALVAGDQTLTVAFPVDFPAEAWSTSNSTWNGKVGDGARLLNASAVVVDDVVVPGTAFENLDYVRNASVTAPSPVYNASEWTGTPIDYPTQGSPGAHSGGVSFPAITAISTDPATPSVGDPVLVSATITDGGANLTSAELHWGLASDTLSSTISMSLVSGDTWTADSTIPGQSSGTTVYFEVEAFNDVPVSTVSELQSYTMAQAISVYDIQGQTASSPYQGTTVLTQGVVTAVYGTTYVIQDGTGPWTGLWVDGTPTPSVGDLVDVQGDVTENFGTGFEGTTLLANAQILNSSTGVLPAAANLTVFEASVEAQEGVLVAILDAACMNIDLGDGVWQVDDGSGLGRIGELGFDSTPVLGTRYDVTGPLLSSGGVLQIEPRSGADILWAGDTFAPVLLGAEADDLVTVRATFSEALDPVSAAVAGNYFIPGLSISTAERNPVNPSQVLLTTAGMTTGSYELTVNGVEDLYGNAVAGANTSFQVNLYGPPAGYYSTALGLSGVALRSELHQIIDNHTEISYTATLTVFQTSDDKPNGKVWDMYSDTPGTTPPYEYTFGVDNGSSASDEGQGYNREHSWPRSWFGGAIAPMNSDLFQLYPTDIYVNSIRGSFPYGEVDVPDWVSLNGSKRGPNVYPGYVGTVFEPIDAYKGDFARSYFYMTVRYYTEDGTWPTSEMTSGADLLPWAEAMLYEWHVQDPVSIKERERNHVLYGFQGNRNPFIDHPEFAAAMFEISTAVGEEFASQFQLRANVPNPFSSSTSISFSLDRTHEVSLSIYDVRGRRVAQLLNGSRGPGVHSVSWNGRDGSGMSVAAGTYFYRLKAGDQVETRRMAIVR